MNKKLLWIIIGVVVLIVVMVGLQKAGAFGKDEGTKVTAEKVSKRTIIETVTASGKVYPEIEVKVSPDISGEIVDLTVQEGDSVKKGQVLAKIYADIYATQRDQAAASVNQQQAVVSNSTAQLEALKATMDQAERTYNRQKQLAADKVISKAEFEQAESSYLTTRANYNAAIQGIRGGKAGVQNAQANLTKANKDLGRTVITAPMSGVISLLSVKKGERVAGNSFNVGKTRYNAPHRPIREFVWRMRRYFTTGFSRRSAKAAWASSIRRSIRAWTGPLPSRPFLPWTTRNAGASSFGKRAPRRDCATPISWGPSTRAA